MTYSILDGNKDEIAGTRTSDYGKAYNTWKRMYRDMICFLVCWDCDSIFRVLEPQ
jgi:hypothetical protein